MTAHILVVDDDAEIRALVAELLDFEGYDVEVAADGVAALEAIARNRPALMLLDMRMPRLDGWGVALAVHEQGLHLPILVMTAASDAQRWAAEIGADGYVAKPFELDALVAAVERLRAA